MGYILRVGSVNKRVNSTLRPTFDTWASFEVNLKTPTDYDKPVLTLAEEFASFAPQNYNYAVIFGRYYWITGLRALRTNLIELSLSLDIFASRRDEILATKAFIEYGSNTFDASAASTYRIPDARRPLAKNSAKRHTTGDITGGKWSSEGIYIMQSVNGDGGVEVHALSQADIYMVMSAVNTDITRDINNIINDTSLSPNEKLVEMTGIDLKTSLLSESAFNAIISVIWLPLDYSILSDVGFDGLDLLHLGRFNTGYRVPLLKDKKQWWTGANFPINWPAPDWQRCNCQMSFYIPFFGTIPMPVDQLINNDSIHVEASVDLFTGDMALTIGVANYTFYAATTNISAPYGIAQNIVGTRGISGGVQALGGVLQGMTGAIDMGAGIAGAVLSGSLIGGASMIQGANSIVQGASNALGGYAQMIQPAITSAGSMAGLASLGLPLDAELTVIYFPAAIDPDFETLYGHPVMMVDYPAYGFCKTRGFSIALQNEPQYISVINAAMDGGMFIE